MSTESVVVLSLVMFCCDSHFAPDSSLRRPIINFGKRGVRDKIEPQVLAGKKFVVLAISEAFAGSDCAGLNCFKALSKDWFACNIMSLKSKASFL